MACYLNDYVDEDHRKLVEITKSASVGSLLYNKYKKSGKELNNFLSDRYKEQLKDYNRSSTKRLNGTWDTQDQALKAYQERLQVYDFVRLPYNVNNNWNVYVYKPVDLSKQFNEVSFGFAASTETNQFEKFKNILNSEKRVKYNLLNKLEQNIKSIKSKLKTDSENIDLQSKLTRLVNSEKRLQDEIQDVNSKLEVFEEQADIDWITTVGSKQLDYVEELLNKPELALNEIVEAGSIIDIWSNIRGLLFDEKVNLVKEVSDKLEGLTSRANSSSIIRKWNNLAREEVKRQMSYSSNSKLRENELFTSEDVNAAFKFTMDISRTGNSLVSGLDKWLKDAAYRQNLEFQETEKNIKDTLKDLSKLDNEKLWQKGDNGKTTGNLTNRYSPEFWEATKNQYYFLKKNIESDSSKQLKQKAFKDFFTWKKNNKHAINFNFFTQNNYKTLEFKSKQDYISFLEKQFGKQRVEELINRSLDGIEKYNNDKSQYLEYLDTLEISDKEREDKLIGWQTFNSPESYLHQFDLNNNSFNQKDNKYIVEIPLKYNAKGEETGYYDKNYESIENNQKLLEKYNFVRSTIQEMLGYLPEYAKSDIEAKTAFIPIVQKDFLQQLMNKNYEGMLTGLKEEFVNGITSDYNDYNNTPIDPFTNLPFKAVPIRFLHGERETAVTDMEQILTAFSYMALNYKHKSNVEDKVLLANKVFQQTVEKHKKSNEYKSPEQSSTNLKEQVQFTLDAILYNEKRKDELVSDKKIFVNKKDKNKYKELQKQIDELEEKLYNGEITQENYDKSIQPLEEESKKLGRNIVGSKIIDKAITFQQLKALGFNPFSAVNNYIFGVISNIIHGSGKTDFTQKQATKALGMSIASIRGMLDKKSDKMANLVAKFDLLAETLESQYGNVKGFNKTLNAIKNAPYELLRKGDYFIKAQTMVATMMNTKVTDINGKERSLWEAFDNEGNWKTEEFGDNKGWNGNVNNEGELQDFLDFRNKLMQIEKKLHGNFDPNSPQMAKKYVLGRALGQFRISWMPEGFASRFEGKKYDELLGREVEGRYRTFGKLGFKKSLEVMFKLAIFQGDKSFKGVKSADRKLVEENMRRNLTEMYLYAILSILYLSLKGAADDDKNKGAKKMTLNMAYRSLNDINFYLSPSTFTELVKSPFPVLKVYTDFNRMRKAVQNEVFDNWDGVDDYDSDRMWLNTTNAFPFLNQFNKFKYMSEKDMSNLQNF